MSDNIPVSWSGLDTKGEGSSGTGYPQAAGGYPACYDNLCRHWSMGPNDPEPKPMGEHGYTHPNRLYYGDESGWLVAGHCAKFPALARLMYRETFGAELRIDIDTPAFRGAVFYVCTTEDAYEPRFGCVAVREEDPRGRSSVLTWDEYQRDVPEVVRRKLDGLKYHAEDTREGELGGFLHLLHDSTCDGAPFA